MYRLRPSAARAGNCEMRCERAVVPLKAQRLQCRSYFRYQRLQMLIGFNAYPENARRSWMREESCSLKAQPNRMSRNLLQGLMYFIDVFRFAKKLQRDVESLREHPPNISSKRLETIAKISDASPDFRVDIECYEQAHAIT